MKLRRFLVFTLGGTHFKEYALTDQVALIINESKVMERTELNLLFLLQFKPTKLSIFLRSCDRAS